MWAEVMASPASVRPTDERPGVGSPFGSGRHIRAVLFDLDGTLYHQPAMRALMALELTTAVFGGLRRATRTWRGLTAYRKAQEELRAREARAPSTKRVQPADQLVLAASTAGLSEPELASIVAEWMFERPLKYLPLCRARGLHELVNFLEHRGLDMGVLSDYPVGAKLRALGLADRFSLVLCSTDRDIGAFKPSPRGFLRAAAHWRLAPGEVLMVGDRPELDAVGATAAGMPCAIIGRVRVSLPESARCLAFQSLERLRRALDDRR
jgi:phosphoglycolate phosphatase/putative hydrolase of the HAD superfamily